MVRREKCTNATSPGLNQGLAGFPYNDCTAVHNLPNHQHHDHNYPMQQSTPSSSNRRGYDAAVANSVYWQYFVFYLHLSASFYLAIYLSTCTTLSDLDFVD